MSLALPAGSISTHNLQRYFEFIDKIEEGVVRINRPTVGEEPYVLFVDLSSWGMMNEQDEAASLNKTVYLAY